MSDTTEHYLLDRMLIELRMQDTPEGVHYEIEPFLPIALWLRAAFDISGSEAERHIKQGAVSWNGQRVNHRNIYMSVATCRALEIKQPPRLKRRLLDPSRETT